MIKPDNPRQEQTIKLISNEKTPYNSRLPQRGVTWLIQSLCFYQTFVQAESLLLLNPPMRQAAKR